MAWKMFEPKDYPFWAGPRQTRKCAAEPSAQSARAKGCCFHPAVQAEFADLGPRSTRAFSKLACHPRHDEAIGDKEDKGRGKRHSGIGSDQCCVADPQLHSENLHQQEGGARESETRPERRPAPL
jgi:hypothetical protein